ncbi:MAG TPA: GNAT family N-acetyltransferase [Terracidiphilus sp.]|nr:GNAT family N-acetyltransferase [Terracidiphilus sp.]
MPDSVQYTLLRTTKALRAFAPQWTALWQQDQDATPFQRPEWLLPWWHQFHGSELRAVTITKDGTLLGFLPFYLYQEPRTRERQLLPLGVGTTDYLNGVFAPDCMVSQIRRGIEMVCAEDGWDTLYASDLPLHSKLAQALESLAEPEERFASEGCSRMAAVPIAALPQKIRRNAMYYRNRARRQGSLELTVADASSWAESFDALVRLHTERWGQNGENGVLADPRVLAWHREVLPLLEQNGCLRLCTLRLEGEIIAVLYALVDPPSRPSRTQYFYLTAYSIHHADLRPGTLLLALAIEHAANEGVATIDMLRGDEAYKQLWHLERAPTRGFALRRSSIGKMAGVAA